MARVPCSSIYTRSRPFFLTFFLYRSRRLSLFFATLNFYVHTGKQILPSPSPYRTEKCHIEQEKRKLHLPSKVSRPKAGLYLQHF